MVLRGVFHDQQTSVLQDEGDGLLGLFMFETKLPFRPEANRSNGWIIPEHFLVIAVPSDSRVPILVKIEEAGVKGSSGQTLHGGFECEQLYGPREGLLRRS